MDEYQLRREALLDAEVSAVQNGNTDDFYRINAELESLDNEFRTVQEVKNPSNFRKFGQYVLGGLAVAGLAMTGAAKDMVSSLDDSLDPYFSEANNAQMVSDLDVNYTITNGNYIASLEDSRFINVVDINSGDETQLRANDYNEIGSMNMDGDVLQYTTMTSKGDEQLYRLIELDLNTFQSSVITEEVSVTVPDFYTQHDTDGTNNAYIDNGSVVRNGEIVYNLGDNSLPSVNGDTVAFASEQTKDNETTQNVVSVANGKSNIIYSGNQSVEFVEFLDGEVVYGLENLINNKAVDLHVGNVTQTVPSGMFDADNGNLTWIEQTEDGFAINLYNFETNQTENIYVSLDEMRNPQMSGDIVTWEQKYGLSESFKSWYSDVTDLMNFESEVPVDNGTVDNGTIDNGTVDNGTIDNGTVDNGTVDNGTDVPIIPEVPETEYDYLENYLAEIAIGAGVGLLGLGYVMGKRRDKKLANKVATIVDDRLGAATSADELNRVSEQMETLNEGLETYGTFNKRVEALETQGSSLYDQAKETQELVDFLAAAEQPNYEASLTNLTEQISGITKDISSLKEVEQPNYEDSLTNLTEQISGITKDISTLKEVEQPNYENQLTGLSEQVSDVQEIVDSLKGSNVAERMAELDRRKAEINDLEAKLEEKSNEIETAAKEVSIKRIPGKAYWMLAGAALAATAVWGEYTGAIDLVNLTEYRG